MNALFYSLVVAFLMAMVAAECPSACSGHGTCGAYDACTCFRNWMSNDCSERICPFGLAHVDTPLGDLDASSGRLTGPTVNVVKNSAMYPQGTSEQFPAMQDSAGNVLSNTAHYYRECSNKGICDRVKGDCACFPGYEGSACQRASCPSSSAGVCSGHGTCDTIQELAAADNQNIYRLWDEDVTMGCNCDAGYTGPDCSERTCKVGYDPLYYDDFQNVRYTNVTVQFFVVGNVDVYGNYSIVFTDVHGEDWQTDPIDIDANCGVIQKRLESLPNNVVPQHSVRCFKHDAGSESSGMSSLHLDTTLAHIGQEGVRAGNGNATVDSATNQYITIGASVAPVFNKTMSIVNKFTLAFPGNPGALTPLKINTFLDGKRPTLFSTELSLPSLGVHVYSNGFHGETTDDVNDECEGVLVGLASDSLAASTAKFTQYLSFDDNIQFERMKKCLGDADGITTNNVEVYDWDYGTFMNPHLIKLVDATQDRFTEFVRSDGTSYKVLAASETPAGGGDGAIDRNQDGIIQTYEQNIWDAVPMTRLCDNLGNGGNWVHDNYKSSGRVFPMKFQKDFNTANLGTRGWCRNYNPPGFYAIIYFDDCSISAQSFTLGVLSHANTDYNGDGSTTPYTVKTASASGRQGAMCDTGRKGFRVLTRPATDYSTTTRFHVYTTKGTLQQVSAHSAAYTTTNRDMLSARKGSIDASAIEFIQNLHSNVIHVRNTTLYGAQGQVDCETAAVGKYRNYDCLNKGDKIFLVNLGDRDTGKCVGNGDAKNLAGATIGTQDHCYYRSDRISYNSNPMYPNMYTVTKIGKLSKDGTIDEPSAANDGDGWKSSLNAEGYRHIIHLNMGVNTNYVSNSRSDTRRKQADFISPDTSATIYKFYPPTLATTGTTGYEYVAECSNRGICDSTTGICQCFSGYTGQDCGTINSLAK